MLFVATVCILGFVVVYLIHKESDNDIDNIILETTKPFRKIRLSPSDPRRANGTKWSSLPVRAYGNFAMSPLTSQVKQS